MRVIMVLAKLIKIPMPSPTFSADGLHTLNYFGGLQSNGDDRSLAFQEALIIARNTVTHSLYHEWRLWTACQLIEGLLESALSNDQPFCYVEAGVGEAITLLVSINYLSILAVNNPNQCNIARFNLYISSNFVLFDTFAGVDVTILDPLEVGNEFETHAYGGSTLNVISRRLRNIGLFAPNLNLIQGSLPSTLSMQPEYTKAYSFLHVDMNNIVPEIGVLRYYLPLLRPGKIILLDDYGFNGHELQRNAINNYMDSIGLPRPLSLPTGQGLIIG